MSITFCIKTSGSFSLEEDFNVEKISLIAFSATENEPLLVLANMGISLTYCLLNVKFIKGNEIVLVEFGYNRELIEEEINCICRCMLANPSEN